MLMSLLLSCHERVGWKGNSSLSVHFISLYSQPLSHQSFAKTVVLLLCFWSIKEMVDVVVDRFLQWDKKKGITQCIISKRDILFMLLLWKFYMNVAFDVVFMNENIFCLFNITENHTNTEHYIIVSFNFCVDKGLWTGNLLNTFSTTCEAIQL